MVLHWILHYSLLQCALIAISRTEEVFNTTPSAIKTNFSCLDRPMGFYADVEANCRVYHTCDDHGNKFTYRCPEETAFRQDAMICDHAHLVDCQATVYPSNRLADENHGKDEAGSSMKRPTASVDSLNDHRLSFSRSFQVIQRPDKSVPDKSGFVFSSSLFLRDQDRTRDRAVQRTADIADTAGICNGNSKNRVTASTAPALTERFYSWNTRRSDKSSHPPGPQSLSSSETRDFARDKSAAYLRRSFAPIASPSPATSPDVTQRPPPLREKFVSLSRDDYRPYSETLKSIQANAVRVTTSMRTTTEIPVHALTRSLKPLIPNELEYDPYYPKQPTSTEAYYTPSDRNHHRLDANVRLSTFNQVPLGHVNLSFEIPPVLPDLNTLEDLVDRRKLFYIPRASARSM